MFVCEEGRIRRGRLISSIILLAKRVFGKVIKISLNTDKWLISLFGLVLFLFPTLLFRQYIRMAMHNRFLIWLMFLFVLRDQLSRVIIGNLRGRRGEVAEFDAISLNYEVEDDLLPAIGNEVTC